MNVFEQIQAADFAAEMISSGINGRFMVHVIYNYDFYQGLSGLSTPIHPDDDRSGLSNRYYTLNELVGLGLLQHKIEALDFYADELRQPQKAEISYWLHSGESHLVVEALINLSWSYAHYPAVALCRKPRSQW